MLLKGGGTPLVRMSSLEVMAPRVIRVQPQRRANRARCVAAVHAVSNQETSETQEPSQPPPQQEKKEGWWSKSDAPNMRDVGSIQELVDELADAGDKLVIVEFYAPWCNACKALYPKLCKLMAEHVDDVLFLKVSFEANKDMCKTMGVKVLPYFHFYRGAEGRVDQFSCTISKIQRFKDALELYTAAFCSLDGFPGVEEFPDIKAHGGLNGTHGTHPDKPTELTGQHWSD